MNLETQELRQEIEALKRRVSRLEKSGGGAALPERSGGMLSLDEAADLIGCTRRFLQRRIEDGEIAVFRPSARLTRIRLNDLEKWIEQYSTKKAT